MMHLPTLAERPDLFTIAGLADIDRATLDMVAARYHVERTTRDYHELLAPRMSRRCSCWRRVLIGPLSQPHSPPANTSSSKSRSASASLRPRSWPPTARASGRAVQVGYHKRFDPAYRRARDLVRNLADLRLIEVTVLHPDEDPYRRHHALLPRRDSAGTERGGARRADGSRRDGGTDSRRAGKRARCRRAAAPARRDVRPADQPHSRHQSRSRPGRRAGGSAVRARVARRHGAIVAHAICRRPARVDDVDFRAGAGALRGARDVASPTIAA